MLGYKALRVSGKISLYDDEHKVSFAAYVSKFKVWDGEADVAVMWIAFTWSNDEKDLDYINYMVDLSLTKARISPAFESYKKEKEVPASAGASDCR